jgi:hypothetical protein
VADSAKWSWTTTSLADNNSSMKSSPRDFAALLICGNRSKVAQSGSTSCLL